MQNNSNQFAHLKATYHSSKMVYIFLISFKIDHLNQPAEGLVLEILIAIVQRLAVDFLNNNLFSHG